MGYRPVIMSTPTPRCPRPRAAPRAAQASRRHSHIFSLFQDSLCPRTGCLAWPRPRRCRPPLGRGLRGPCRPCCLAGVKALLRGPSGAPRGGQGPALPGPYVNPAPCGWRGAALLHALSTLLSWRGLRGPCPVWMARRGAVASDAVADDIVAAAALAAAAVAAVARVIFTVASVAIAAAGIIAIALLLPL